MKKVILTEAQLNMIMEMAYPITFNIDEFSSLTSFAARVKYCNERLKFLGQGTSRRVYMIDDENALNLLKTERGLGKMKPRTTVIFNLLICVLKYINMTQMACGLKRS